MTVACTETKKMAYEGVCIGPPFLRTLQKEHLGFWNARTCNIEMNPNVCPFGILAQAGAMMDKVEGFGRGGMGVTRLRVNGSIALFLLVNPDMDTEGIMPGHA